MFGLLAQLPFPESVAGGLNAPSDPPAPIVPMSQHDLAAQVHDLARQADALNTKLQALTSNLPPTGTGRSLDIFYGYIGVFLVAFVVALLATPIMRRVAIKHGIVDRPNEARKIHRIPIAYLGGVAVYLGIVAAILFSYTTPFHGLITFHSQKAADTIIPGGVPFSVLLGLTVVMICGLIDDVLGLSPRIKIAGILFAAAALATETVGVKVAAGLVIPIAQKLGIPTVPIGGGFETIMFMGIDVVYWIGTAVIAIFVLGACNASNLIDGLDGLLSGVTAIAAAGLLVISLGLALIDDGPRDAARIILCMALLGSCLGFLPHNFNPATIFLGDTGSLMLGYLTIVIVLLLGDTGKTHLVMAGLVIYAIPIMDTTLAIVRRKMAGKKVSDPDDQHLHHMLKRSLGVKGAAFTLYGIGGLFAILGILMADQRQRVSYILVLIFAAFIGVIAMKIGRREHIERQMREAEEKRNNPGKPPTPPSDSSTKPFADGAASTLGQPAPQPVGR
jgi:UDP-GlcNAc:undecaprenyl-phosphate GlcNAc-1-phosphate transferase